ncbi:MAG: hypothetical protein KF686_11335 [Ramlibacter sp.]|nr:hypothetical protein [Ramlibacter sp.]MBX3656835.1 hypothetical protein [Ramlibacter sp.]
MPPPPTAAQPQPEPAPPAIASARGALAARVDAIRDVAARSSLAPLTVSLGGIAVIASIGWMVERRRNRREQDSILWADVQPAASSIVTKARSLDSILPDSPNPAESARAIYVTAIGETNSRREATLIDLHLLHRKLRRRRKRGDHVAALLLLQQHLVDFRYSSPWVFLELRELYQRLDRHKEWDIAREAFRARFGQNAPSWTSPSTADAGLDTDPHLSEQLCKLWPYRTARMWILHWMLGEPEMRARSMGPPLLPLGVYRDFMAADELLDEVITLTPAPADAPPAAP